jgi:hypothetical protein
MRFLMFSIPTMIPLLPAQWSAEGPGGLVLALCHNIQNRDWGKHKFRQFSMKGEVSVNRDMKFGLLRTKNARLMCDRFQSVFRPWAQDTLALLQCPCSRALYAHLDHARLLCLGDDDCDFTIQETARTAINWELGVLRARSAAAGWDRIVVTHNGAVHDLRPTRLAGLESPLVIERPSLESYIPKGRESLDAGSCHHH